MIELDVAVMDTEGLWSSVGGVGSTNMPTQKGVEGVDSINAFTQSVVRGAPTGVSVGPKTGDVNIVIAPLEEDSLDGISAVSYTHLTLPTILRV